MINLRNKSENEYLLNLEKENIYTSIQNQSTEITNLDKNKNIGDLVSKLEKLQVQISNYEEKLKYINIKMQEIKNNTRNMLNEYDDNVDKNEE